MVNTESKIQQLYTGDVIIELECFFYNEYFFERELIFCLFICDTYCKSLI